MPEPDPEDKLTTALGLMQDMRAYAQETFQLWEANNDFQVGWRLKAMAGELRNYGDIPAAFNDFIIKYGPICADNGKLEIASASSTQVAARSSPV